MKLTTQKRNDALHRTDREWRDHNLFFDGGFLRKAALFMLGSGTTGRFIGVYHAVRTSKDIAVFDASCLIKTLKMASFSFFRRI